MGRDMTQGKPWKVILFFTLPLMAGNFLQQFYNTADGIILGNFVGDSALSAIGPCTSLALIFVCLALGFSTGTGIIVAQFWGAGNYGEMRRAISTCLLLTLGMGLSFSALAYGLTPWLMETLLDVPQGEILDMAVGYFRIYSLGILFQFIYNCFAAVLRAMGDSRATLYFLLLSTISNVLLDLLFVAVFHWNAEGAALATIIAQLLSALLSVLYAFRKYPVLRFGPGEFAFDKGKCVLALRFGLTMTVQQSCISIGTLAVQRLVNSFGSITMAACTVGNRIEQFCGIPFTSFSAGLSTYVGQNMGAGKMDRVYQGQKSTLLLSTCISVGISLAAFFLAHPLAALFGGEGASLRQAAEYIRFISFFFILFSFYGTYTAVLQGAGDVLFASLCTLVSFAVRCGAAYLFAFGLGVGYESCWVTIPIGWACCTPVALLRFYKGAWKTKAVTAPKEMEASL